MCKANNTGARSQLDQPYTEALVPPFGEFRVSESIKFEHCKVS